MITNTKQKTKQSSSKIYNIQSRIDAETNNEAQKVLKKIGISKSQVVHALFKQIALKKRIPFELSASEYVEEDISQEQFLKSQLELLTQFDIGEKMPEYNRSKAKPYKNKLI